MAPKPVQFSMAILATTLLWVAAKVVIIDPLAMPFCPIYDFADDTPLAEMNRIQESCPKRLLMWEIGLWLISCFVAIFLIIRTNKRHK